MNIEVILEYDTIKVKFNDIMHLYLKRSKLIGIQSWRYGEHNYYIEFTLTEGVMLADYDDEIKWKTILQGLEQVI